MKTLTANKALIDKISFLYPSLTESQASEIADCMIEYLIHNLVSDPRVSLALRWTVKDMTK